MSLPRKSVVRGGVNVLSRVAGASFQALLMVLLARLSSVPAFGAFGVALSSGAVALGILGLGLPTRVLRSSVRDGVVWSSFRVTALTSVGVSVVAFIFASKEGAEYVWVALAGALYMYAEGIGNLAQNGAFGHRQLGDANILMVTRRLFPFLAVGVVAITSYLFGQARDPYVGLIIGVAVSCTIAVRLIWPERGASAYPVRSLIAESRSYWFTNVWSMLQQLDVLIVGSILGFESAGLYSAGFRVASPVHILTGLIVARMIPEIAQAGDALAVRSVTRRYLALGAGYALAVLLMSPLIASAAVWVLGDQYSQARGIIIILLANSAVSVLNQTLVGLIFGRNRGVKYVPHATAASTLLGLGVVLWGCHQGLLWLAAIGTLSIQVVLTVLVLVILRGTRVRRNAERET